MLGDNLTWVWDPGRSFPQCNLSQTAGRRSLLQYFQPQSFLSYLMILVLCVLYLHAQDGEDVDDDEQDEGEVAEGAQGGYDDTQQNL